MTVVLRRKLLNQTRDSVVLSFIVCWSRKETKNALLQMIHVNVESAVCWQRNPRIPPGFFLNSVNKCVKKTKIKAALTTTSCWSLGFPAPLHVGPTAAGGAALFQTDSLRAPAKCLHGSTAWRSGGKKQPASVSGV